MSFEGKVVSGVHRLATALGIRAVSVVGDADIAAPASLPTIVLVKRFGQERAWSDAAACVAEAALQLLDDSARKPRP